MSDWDKEAWSRKCSVKDLTRTNEDLNGESSEKRQKMKKAFLGNVSGDLSRERRNFGLLLWQENGTLYDMNIR